MRHAEDAQGRRWGRAAARTDLVATVAGLLVVLISGPIAARTAFVNDATPGRPGPAQQAQQVVQQTQQTQDTATGSTPPAPTGVTATAGDRRVSLSWTAVPGAASYSIYTGTSGGFDASFRVLTVSDPAGVVTKLTNGTAYSFWVTAVGGAGESSASGAVHATPVASVTVPGAPTGVHVASRDGRITVTWVAPASDGGSSVTGYDVYAATSPDFRGGLPVAKVSGTSYVLSGRIAGNRWYFKLAAVNARGVGPASIAVSVLIAPDPVTAGPPTSVAVTAGPGQVLLSWTAPATTVSGYRVFLGTRPGGESATPVSQALVHGTSVMLAGLAGGTRFYFTVAAVGPDGHQGAPSAEVTAIPLVPAGSAAVTGSGTRSVTGTRPPAGAPPATGTRPPAGTPPATGTGQAGGAPAATSGDGGTGVIQVAAQDGQATEPASRPATSAHRPPHAALIIALSGVATAALAGAAGAALHLRRRRRLAAAPEPQPYREPAGVIH